MLKKIKVFFINGLILTLTTFLMRTVGFSFSIYISNKVGAEALGTFQLISSVYLFAVTLATSGINLAATRIVVEETTYQVNCNTQKAIRTCLRYCLFLGCISCVLLCVFANFISTSLLHKKVPAYLFYVIAISLPFISMSSALNGYFTALRKNGKNAINRIFEQFIKISSTAYLLSLFFPAKLEYACLSLVLGEAISEVLSFFFAYGLYQFEKRKYLAPSKSHLSYGKFIFKISFPVAITSYIRSGLSSLKQLLIPLRLEKFGMDCQTALSSYGLIQGMTMPVLMFPEVILTSFSGLLVPEFAYYYAQKNYERITSLISYIFRITLLFSVGIIGVFWCYAEPLSQLIYQNQTIVPYLKLLCPLLLFMYLDSIVDNMLKGLDQQLGVMKCNILDLFVSIFCIYFFLPIYGIYGYIMVIFISEFLNTGISIFQLKRITHFRLDWFHWIFQPFLALLVSIGITNLLVPVLPYTLVPVFLHIGIFIGFYFLSLLLFIKIHKKKHNFHEKPII